MGAGHQKYDPQPPFKVMKEGTTEPEVVNGLKQAVQMADEQPGSFVVDRTNRTIHSS